MKQSSSRRRQGATSAVSAGAPQQARRRQARRSIPSCRHSVRSGHVSPCPALRGPCALRIIPWGCGFTRRPRPQARCVLGRHPRGRRRRGLRRQRTRAAPRRAPASRPRRPAPPPPGWRGRRAGPAAARRARAAWRCKIRHPGPAAWTRTAPARRHMPTHRLHLHRQLARARTHRRTPSAGGAKRA